MSGTGKQVIDDRGSLQTWRHQLRTTVSPMSLPAIEVRFPEFSIAQNQNFTARAEHHRTACGCAIGGLFMTIAVVYLVASFFMSGNTFSEISFGNVLSLAGIAVTATLFGKFLGLLWARWRLLRLAAKVHNVIVSTPQRGLTTGSI